MPHVDRVWHLTGIGLDPLHTGINRFKELDASVHIAAFARAHEQPPADLIEVIADFGDEALELLVVDHWFLYVLTTAPSSEDDDFSQSGSVSIRGDIDERSNQTQQGLMLRSFWITA
jgi:hypothetical protein